MFLCVQRIITKKSSEIIKYNIRAIVRLFFFLLLLLLRPIGTVVRYASSRTIRPDVDNTSMK